MKEGGDLTLGFTERMVGEDADLPSGPYVDIRVSDTGTGMPASVAARAFEPFYTTKEVGKGTGLGLSQVYAMARQAGGAARIERAERAGTTIVLSLPLVETAVEVEPAPPRSGRCGHRRDQAGTRGR